MRFLLHIILLFALVGLISCATESHDESKPSARSQFKLPKLFNFEEFKLFFSKNYGSIIEELSKKKLYVARVFAAFVSSLNYKQGKLNSYLSVNQMSDWTPEERDKLIWHRDAVGQDTNGMDEYRKLEELELAIEEVERRKEEPGYRELASELDRLSGARPASESTLLRKKRATNRDGLGKLGAGVLISLVGLAAVALNHGSQPATPAPINNPSTDEVFVDLTRDGCFTGIKFQGQCGSCTSFANIALFEYRFCRQIGAKRSFSEQYLVDCMADDEGKRFGCGGAPGNRPTMFINKFGLEPADKYPYKQRVGVCPFKASQSINSIPLGRYKPHDVSMIYVRQANLTSYLSEGPIVFSIKVNDKFLDYGGGVDPNEECKEGDYHAMLIVGHGREDGQEYLLFRNSYSKFWGEKGHYKMSLGALSRCGADPVGVTSRGGFQGDGTNPFYRAKGG